MLALMNLLKDHKLNVCFIVEPWMNHDKFSASFWDRLDLKLFSVNNRVNLLLNIWCICKRDLDPIIISITDQLVSFSVYMDNLTLRVIAIYALLVIWYGRGCGMI